MRDSWELQAHSVPWKMLAMSLTEVSACVEPFKMCPWFLHQADCPIPLHSPAMSINPRLYKQVLKAAGLEIQILIGLNGFLFHYSSADLLV